MANLPNILFLMPDQLRMDFLGCYGADFLKTPRIDALAAQGTLFTQAISPTPLCVPARASMMTGLPAQATGVLHNDAALRPDRRAMGVESWPERLGAAGYQTAAIGKMHFYPWDASEGFEDRIIAEDKRHIFVEDDYDAALKAEGHRKLHGKDQDGYTAQQGASINALPDHLQPDRWVANQAVHYLAERDRARPFAMMVGFPGPHCPYDPPREALGAIDPTKLPAPIPATSESDSHRSAFLKGYRAPWADIDYSDLRADNIRAIRHHYAALIERLDADVGTILDALQASRDLDNTIVVFASDHGDYVGDFGMVGKTWFHEPSIRVPLIVTDYRDPSPDQVTAPVALWQLHHSFCDWAGLPSDEHLWAAPLSKAHEDCIVGVSTLGVMARDRRWKLVRYSNGTEALFDLQSDPFEQADVLAQHPLIRKQLDAEILRQLMAGLALGHSDKTVPRPGPYGPRPDHKRNWNRPYPGPK